MKNLNEFNSIELNLQEMQSTDGGILPVVAVLVFAAGVLTLSLIHI